MLQTLLQFKLRFLARLYLRHYKPTIIAITGNAGKSSAKEAIGVVVGGLQKTRVAGGNLNNEIGIPLAILGDWAKEYYERGSSIFFWTKVFIIGLFKLIFNASYPKVLVLEYGADHPGDIKKLVRAYPPDISIVTTVGEVPVHIEFFKDANDVAREKSELVRSLGQKDLAILNHDDERVLAMRAVSPARAMTYGFNENASIRITDFEYRSTEDNIPVGTTFKLHHSGSFIPVHIEGSLGKSQAWAAAAAAAVGLSFGMNLVQISQALLHYHGPRGRLRVLPGIKDIVIIDDTYNASPASMKLALETLHDLPAKRKVAILGDMLELGSHTISAHEEAGIMASHVADLIICVGSRAKIIAESAGREISKDRVKTFETSVEAKEKIIDMLEPYDLVLIKGSQGIRMEKIVTTILANPSRARELLARQSKRWLAK